MIITAIFLALPSYNYLFVVVNLNINLVCELVTVIEGMDKQIELSDKHILRYVDAVIWETMRKSNQAPILLPRTVSSDIKVDDVVSFSKYRLISKNDPYVIEKAL